ncbi:MAG: AAA family ATPase, partial [Candidatus Nanopelagicales bacterium]
SPAPAVDAVPAASPAPAGGPSPYRGLEPFTEADAPLFFGREQLVDELATAVTQRASDPDALRILIVVGPSGSGKSSVLRAGLIPRVRNDEHASWAVAALVPGTDPMGALAAARAALGDAPRALLVVDQAEEVFSAEVAPQERTAFIAALVAAAEAGPSPERSTVVVVGLRADFYSQAAADPDILPALRSSQVLLGSMPLDDLRRAIVAPAAAVGVQVEPALVDLLLRDLSPRGQVQSGYDAGALPLVSHALLATWEHHRGDQLTVGDYVAAGGIVGAVQQTAEQVFAELDEPGRAAAQWLFAQLVTVDDDAVMTRRRVSHDDLHHPDRTTDLALDAVIEAFVSGRLLTAGERTLEVSHEALLSAWPRLSNWVRTDLDSTRLHRRISDAAAVWRERDQDAALVLRGSLLADAQQLAAQPANSPRTLSSAEQEYLAASTAMEQAERATERRRTTRLRGLVAVLATLALLAGLLAGLALRSADEARTQQQAATLARDEATSRQLAIAADDLRDADPALAAQLSLAAYQV